ncbi:MAG: bifunctional aspartate kinase/homoserine dehydrogenase I [Leadbetterella sp.]
MKVLKFGGTSVGSIESIQQVLEIIQKNHSENKAQVVVYSAMGGFTNKLLEAGKIASSGKSDYKTILEIAENRHLDVVRHFVDIKSQSALIAQIKTLFNELEDLLKGIMYIGELSKRTQDLLMSFGERLSSYMISEILIKNGLPAKYIDSREIIRTDSNFGYANVDFKISNEQIISTLSDPKTIYCVTGFIGKNTDGVCTTLGRGGSDYTGSILGAALDAEVIEIWTDVNGMMTTDPRKVKNAFTIPEISYAEAMELSHFGAKVIYPPSLIPAFQKNIPIRILNTFQKEHAGTIIQKEVTSKSLSITGISSIDDIALVNIQGNGMIGVAGVSAKVFGLLAENNISVILISQASSEHSICFAIDPSMVSKVKTVLEKGFKSELANGDLENIAVQESLSIIAIVGEGMKASSGTSGKLFSILGKNGINVVATAQGSSELNISVVIQKKDISKSLNAIHEAFFEGDGFTLNVFMVGPTGQIGKTLLKQIQNQKTYLKKEKNLQIKLVGLANSKKMLIRPEGINTDDWENILLNDGLTLNLGEFMEDIQAQNMANSVFVDCTADKDIYQYYYTLLDSNISIVTPNKVANASEYGYYQSLRDVALKRNVKFLYETNVGAGLPLINTLQAMINSGDKIIKIEAVLSGTLSYIFNTFKPGISFLDVVKEAKEKGYTEPDPRDDLSGTDVARKILILARECGYQLNIEDVKIHPLLSEKATIAPSIDAFFEVLNQENEIYAQKAENAHKQEKVLRFIAGLNDGKAEIGLREVGREHPFFSLSGSENIVSFTTERYLHNPLVVKGPGAGAEVTAMGVFGDLISLSSYLS